MSTTPTFEALGLPQSLLIDYETPTPVQAKSIPILLGDEDLIAEAQTGTGKTAAFSLPILAKLDLDNKNPQALIITPTRELAIQVANAFQHYGKHLKNFHVTPIYGGQDMRTQLKALKNGAQVIVGTPGRLMDHIKRGTLTMTHFTTLILDEADEMLKMGFIEDVEWILNQLPEQQQIGLFSATMPPPIKKIAKKYLQQPRLIQIAAKEKTVTAIEQCYIQVTGHQKFDALIRILEVETINAAIIFTRTKNQTLELAEKLQSRNLAIAALNGDMNQHAREKVLNRLLTGALNIVVATDIAARGIDIDRISHVINYDIPYDSEAYIHRIGRTGRAGRTGKAILFATPRENYLLKEIEKATQTTIKKILPPSIQELTEKRLANMADTITNIIAKSKKLIPYREMVETIIKDKDLNALDVAAALTYLSQQKTPLPSEELQQQRQEQRKKPASRRRRDRRPHKSAKTNNAERSFMKRQKRQSRRKSER